MQPIERYQARDLGPKDWGEELLIGYVDIPACECDGNVCALESRGPFIVRPGAGYTFKRLTYRAGAKGPLQHHVTKDETFYLHSGSALVRFDDGQGNLVTKGMLPGQSYHIPPGAPHQFEALTECIVFEASTPVFDDRVSDEERYAK